MQKTKSYDAKKSRGNGIKNNPTGWKLYKNPSTGFVDRRLMHRVVNYRYTDGMGDINVWVWDTGFILGPNGEPIPPKLKWAITHGDERTRPHPDEFRDFIPRDRNWMAEAAWHIEKKFKHHVTGEQLPHLTGISGSEPAFSTNTQPHPDDAPPGHYTPKQAADWMRRKRMEFDNNGWEW